MLKGEDDKPVYCSIKYDSFLDKNLKSHLENLDSSAQRGDTPNVDRYRRISKMIMTAGDKEVDISKLNGRFSIYVYLREKQDDPVKKLDSNSSISGMANLIRLESDLRAPSGVFTLLHELGHAEKITSEDPKDINDEKEWRVVSWKIQNNTELTTQDKALVVRLERSADAYAIKKFRAIAGNEYTKRIIKFQAHRRIKSCLDEVEKRRQHRILEEM